MTPTIGSYQEKSRSSDRWDEEEPFEDFELHAKGQKAAKAAQEALPEGRKLTDKDLADKSVCFVRTRAQWLRYGFADMSYVPSSLERIESTQIVGLTSDKKRVIVGEGICKSELPNDNWMAVSEFTEALAKKQPQIAKPAKLFSQFTQFSSATQAIQSAFFMPRPLFTHFTWQKSSQEKPA